MKRILYSLIITIAFSAASNAQLRENLPNYYDYSGNLINMESPTVDTRLNQFFNSIQMSHSYSMNFSSFGGNYQNVNAYTNTMQFMISPRMSGRVDVQFLHSPFGGNYDLANTGGFENQILLRNAELNYQISDKAFLRIQYQRLPAGYGFGYNPYGYNRFGYW
ncbi:MAG: hypothetical protein MI700_11165 [Balneolales bacterium]|nr:hypothetical protein [Balneolales bacterium]